MIIYIYTHLPIPFPEDGHEGATKPLHAYFPSKYQEGLGHYSQERCSNDLFL